MPSDLPVEILPNASGAGTRSLWGDGLFLVALALIAAGFGVGLNRFRAQPLPLVYKSKTARLQQSVARLASRPPGDTPPPSVAEPEAIGLAQFHELAQGGTIILDARPGLFFRMGHVLGARSLPRETFETDYARLRTVLESHRQEMLVVYCAGEECVDSRMVAAALQKLGYARVLIFTGGWDEWRQAGLPEERS